MLGVILYLLSIVLAMFRLTKCFIRKKKNEEKSHLHHSQMQT